VRQGPTGDGVAADMGNSIMLKDIKSFFAELTGETKQQAHFGESDYRLAAAALLVHVATLDRELSEEARAKLHTILKGPFALSDAETEELIDAAIVADHDAVDFYHFTSLINRVLDDEGRRRVVAMMWETVYLDGKASEFEDNVMWRVSDLLNIPPRERIALRRRVSGEEA
jgi:uncharacterized tellurite resistance protein B-like protein